MKKKKLIALVVAQSTVVSTGIGGEEIELSII